MSRAVSPAPRRLRLGARLATLLALALAPALVAAPARAELPKWAREKPGPETQVQKEPALRGGVNPCNTRDPGPGSYGPWSRAPSMGQMIVPRDAGRAVGADHGFDLVIHFHGHEAVRKEWVQVMDRAILVGIDLGIGSTAYRPPFQSPERFRELVASVERAVAEASGDAGAHVRHLGLSAWSAGYGAVGELLARSEVARAVDTVVLLDGLHSGYVGDEVDPGELAPFLSFARRAAAGDKLMFVSHSSIIPPGYASTTETSNYLVAMLGGRPRAGRARASDPMGLELLDHFDRGGFHVRGFAGNAKMDHCAHIGLFRDVLAAHVKPRWGEPAAAKPKGKPVKGKPKSKAGKGAPAALLERRRTSRS
ncbi:MAG: hypothetical protein HY908_06795 [Myxococcales bacterium]|nr:hypothetical protein [Myxococcales bacterium]